jgi:hypothetical protein
LYKQYDDKPYPKSREEVVKEREEAKRRILEENSDVSKDTRIYAIITSRTKNTQSHGTGNYTCNSRAATRRNGKTIEEKERGINNIALTIQTWA